MPQVKRAVFTLRTELFPTMHREITNKIVLSYTGHVPDNRVDAQFVEYTDCTKGYFGCSFHYVITTEGIIEVGRDPRTRSSRTRMRRMHKSAIFIGVVGGLALDTGYRTNTTTPEQDVSVEWLVQELADTLGESLELTDYIETWGDSRSLTSPNAGKARDTEFLSILYANMDDTELAATTDRVTI